MFLIVSWLGIISDLRLPRCCGCCPRSYCPLAPKEALRTTWRGRIWCSSSRSEQRRYMTLLMTLRCVFQDLRVVENQWTSPVFECERFKQQKILMLLYWGMETRLERISESTRNLTPGCCNLGSISLQQSEWKRWLNLVGLPATRDEITG